MNRYFFKNIQISYNHMKCYSCEMQIKTTLSYNFTSTRMAIIKKDNKKCWEGYGEIETLIYCWWGCKIVKSLRKIICQLLNKLNLVTTGYSNFTPRHMPKKYKNIHPHKNLHMTVHNCIIRYSKQMQTIQMPINRSMDK